MARVTGAVAVTSPLVAVGFLLLIARTPFVTNQSVELAQPVQFDHRHHSKEEGIDCLFCHSGAERSAVAGIPTASLCMGCHGQVWNQSPRLEPVRQAFFSARPIPWVKVHDLPDFVYFDHSIHLAKGVGCVTCHGRVDEMPTVRQAVPLTMSWCLDCHRDAAPHLRPRRALTDLSWSGPPERRDDVHPRESCDTCHR